METETGRGRGDGMLQDAELLMVQHILSSREVFMGMRDQHHPLTLTKNPSPVTLPRFGDGQGKISAGFVLPTRPAVDLSPAAREAQLR